MTDLQKVILNIAKEFIRVCKLLNLRWFVSDGTLLGAMRHRGFIPWDDDMDFVMPRPDYEILLKKGPKLFSNPFFLQTRENDKGYYHPFAKLRNSNTTMVEREFEYLNINHGCWIDIFPLDGYPNDIKKTKKKFAIKDKFFYRRYTMRKVFAISLRQTLTNIILIVIIPTKKLAITLEERQFKNYDFDNSLMVGLNWTIYDNNAFLMREWFDDKLEFDFEDIKVNVPIGWELYLKKAYGNWRKLPPKERRVNDNHHISLLDLNRPYWAKNNHG